MLRLELRRVLLGLVQRGLRRRLVRRRLRLGFAPALELTMKPTKMKRTRARKTGCVWCVWVGGDAVAFLARNIL